ncbi:hypothetical protein H6G06_08710 [Anabaena sphaerica FACHB-251]|uniref:Uncharacterized protein n=1 Tax=Anabaena sphaerica FACHB-251 TaxID=2692883 RepID=A0A926WG65_9NOST|nr:hypothetical protein [Anabaena sphaerica]MBD2293567.1 hypothetical protein [Anabaena sphaerica FACHB-251]
MNVQLVDYLVEIVAKLTPEEQQLFQEKLNSQDYTLYNKKPLPNQEKLKIWQEWIEKAPVQNPKKRKVDINAVRNICNQIRNLPMLDPRTPDEIIGYNEFGIFE